MDTHVRGVEGTPNEAALLRLMEKSGYSMIQENGQRKYGGPPPGWEGPPPQKGCEIFVGKIPRDVFEDELVPVFEQIGKLYEMRLMMDFSGTNRGYAFVMYMDRNDARRAVKDLNNYEIRKDRYLGVCMSVDNCRLFVGGIPKSVTKEEIMKEMKKVTEGVVDVIVYPSAPDKSKNRGFAFVEYESHRAAAMARRKLIPGKIQLFGNQIAVDWAEPEREVDDDVMDKVRILYMRNLMLTTSEETIKKACGGVLGKEECVERVKKIRDYAFVHFKDRKDALMVKEALNRGYYRIDGCLVEVTLAKPVDRHDPLRDLEYDEYKPLEGSDIEVTLAKPADKTGDNIRYSRGVASRAVLPQEYWTFYQQNQQFMYPGAPPYMAGQQPPMVTPSTTVQTGFTPRGGANVGRGGFTPRGGMVRGRGRGAAGSMAASARGGYNSNYRGGYKKHPVEDHLYDLQPGMELTPINPVTLKPQAKSPVQVLEEWCAKNGLGAPIYQLHATNARDSTSGEQVQLYVHKVTIPAMMNQYPTPFTPSKLSRSPEEAKVIAAEHTLSQLGVPLDMLAQSLSSLSMSDVPGNQTPPVSSPVTSMYQGRPIYSMTNGASSDYASTIPSVVSTTVTYMPPGKVAQMSGDYPANYDLEQHPPMFYASPAPPMPPQHNQDAWI